jgi:hypothetical protein
VVSPAARLQWRCDHDMTRASSLRRAFFGRASFTGVGDHTPFFTVVQNVGREGGRIRTLGVALGDPSAGGPRHWPECIDDSGARFDDRGAAPSRFDTTASYYGCFFYVKEKRP